MKFKTKKYILKIKETILIFINKYILSILYKIINFFHLKQFCEKTQLVKFWKKIKKIDKNIYKKTFILLFIPIIIYLYSQLFCDGKIIFEKPRMLLNFIFIYFIIGFFYCIFGKVKISLYITMVSTFFIGLINHFITAFRGTPLVPWDIFSLNVALTVLPTFKFFISKKTVIAVILFSIGFLSLRKIKFESFKNNIVKKLYRIIVLIVTVLFTINFYTTDLIKKFELDENWDPKEEYHNNGLIASLFKQSRNLIIKEPDGYDIDSVKKIAQSIEIPIAEQTENCKTPNIIAIMNESFADLSVINNFTTNKEYLPFFNSLKDNTIKGNLHVSIFGATTPNTEWEFLTSNSMAFVPKRTVPYQQYVLKSSYSLATILKIQGYSAIAIHSYYPQGYNRNLTYPRLGFESFYHINNMKNLEYIREYPDDLSTYKNIIYLYENRDKNKKFFNFTLTMQNHGSYTDENFPNTVIANNGEYPRLNQYLSLIKIADNAFEYLIDYFAKQEEPTIIVMFGDHQPYVEDEFYDKLLESYEDTNSKKVIEKKYITPFIIWANYDIDEKKYSDITDISVNYLASLVLDVAGLQKTPYLSFLDNLRKEIPIITGNGYMDKNGTYHDFDEKNQYTKLINNYYSLQYNNMFDNSDKIPYLFEVPN